MPKILLFLLLVTALDANAQLPFKKKEYAMLNDPEDWFEGEIVLTDGTTLRDGLVKFTDNNGILAFHDGDRSRSFGPRSVVSFHFFDEKEQRHRKFLTLEVAEYESDVEKPLFFEILKEYESFAILSRVGILQANSKGKRDLIGNSRLNQYPNSDPTAGKLELELSQVEFIYIMDVKGKLQLYLKLTNTDDGEKGLFSKEDTKTKSKIDKDLLIDYISEPVYMKLKEFAKNGRLSFKRKEDFMKILNYYDQIK